MFHYCAPCIHWARLQYRINADVNVHNQHWQRLNFSLQKSLLLSVASLNIPRLSVELSMKYKSAD